MRPRTGSIRLPLYKDGPKLRERDVSPDSPTYRSSRPHQLRTRRSRWRAWLQTYYRTSLLPRDIKGVLKRLLIVALVGLFYFYWYWEIHMEIFVYSRSWISREVLTVEPLSGCFDPRRISSRYNATRAFGPKRHEVQAGLPMRMGLDCYDFAATVQPSEADRAWDGEGSEGYGKTNYHAYWRADLVPFGERQEWMIKSFFATQDLSRSVLILWSNGDLRSNPFISSWLSRFPQSFQLRIVNVDALSSGTALEQSPLIHQKDSKAWVDGDLVRLLVIWAFGGVWVDMDSLLTRDLRPLLEHEFFTQWDCYDKPYTPFNGALMHFEQHSPYLCEAFNIIASSPPPRHGSVDWGTLLYTKLWRRLVAGGIPPFKILPFCFSDGRSCRLDNRLPDPFVKDPKGGRWPLRGPAMTGPGGLGMEAGGALDRTLQKVFSVHLHNQWEKSFPRDGWVDRLLLRAYDRQLGLRA
ncbi:hypothetical protein SISSUDRAFT_987638 [Sistotremastrum suecicum HHB10207 ss-3]|uniref:Glycosyltransferase family 32 protein n=1 Tax=Sistotremastrum suecicum HHB10207 ss-3 TaxID=1314776 RepID=A0A166CH69_9AGAM|nr:hypothetical protein SISSUDRAFT_987638 [Sistotremastrum suecicum HHB10207 ss-3]